MKKSIKIAIYLLIILGFVHSSLTFVFFKSFNDQALWFFGTGLMYIFMGLYNLAAIKVQFRSISNIAVILNFIGTIFTVAITYILREPQAFVALILVIYIFLGSIISVK